MQPKKARSNDDPVDKDKIEWWSSQWRQDRMMIQSMKEWSDDDLVSESKIGRWYS